MSKEISRINLPISEGKSNIDQEFNKLFEEVSFFKKTNYKCFLIKSTDFFSKNISFYPAEDEKIQKKFEQLNILILVAIKKCLFNYYNLAELLLSHIKRLTVRLLNFKNYKGNSSNKKVYRLLEEIEEIIICDLPITCNLSYHRNNILLPCVLECFKEIDKFYHKAKNVCETKLLQSYVDLKLELINLLICRFGGLSDQMIDEIKNIHPCEDQAFFSLPFSQKIKLSRTILQWCLRSNGYFLSFNESCRTTTPNEFAHAQSYRLLKEFSAIGMEFYNEIPSYYYTGDYTTGTDIGFIEHTEKIPHSFVHSLKAAYSEGKEIYITTLKKQPSLLFSRAYLILNIQFNFPLPLLSLIFEYVDKIALAWMLNIRPISTSIATTRQARMDGVGGTALNASSSNSASNSLSNNSHTLVSTVDKHALSR